MTSPTGDYGTPIKPCPNCGNAQMSIELMQAGPHWGRYVCHDCDNAPRAIWASNPNKNKTPRPAGHRKLSQRLKDRGIDYCQICLRHESDLHRTNTLEAHHVIEYADGGTDEPGNAWQLCTQCHRQVHWIRLFLSHATPNSEPDRIPTPASQFRALPRGGDTPPWD